MTAEDVAFLNSIDLAEDLTSEELLDLWEVVDSDPLDVELEAILEGVSMDENVPWENGSRPRSRLAMASAAPTISSEEEETSEAEDDAPAPFVPAPALRLNLRRHMRV